MAIDSREGYEDLIVERAQHRMEPDDCRQRRDFEAIRSGGIVGTVTLDDHGRAPCEDAS